MDIAITVTVTVSASHDGVNTSGYRLLVDGAVAAEKDVSELAGSSISFAHQSAVGETHAYAIEAVFAPLRSETKTVVVS